MSPNGRRLYISAGGGRNFGGNYLVTFAVDPRTGTVRQLQCLTEQARSHCPSATIPSAGELLVSPDSRYVYAADPLRPLIDVYRAGAHGLAPAQCVRATPVQGQSCTLNPLLAGPAGIEGFAETHDGSELYAVAVQNDVADRVVGLRRDPASGLLSAGSGPAQCASDEQMPPPGCIPVGLTGTQLSFSSTGDTLYAASGPELAVAALTRDPATGALGEAALPAGCVEFSSFPMRACGAAPRWSGELPRTVPSSSGGLLVSAVDQHDNAVAVVEVTRSAAGALAANDQRGCGVGRCRALRGGAGDMAGALAISPDGRSVYVADGDGIAQIRIRGG
jgi:hypothetical protein